MSDLGSQEEVTKVYTERNEAVAVLVKLAKRLGYDNWYADDEDAEWPVVFVRLPYAGQVSWHIPVHEFLLYFPNMTRRPREWDGHTNEQKSERLRHEAGIPTRF